MSQPDISKYLITESTSIKDAMKQSDISGSKILFVTDHEHFFIGSLSDGDIRRSILSDGILDKAVIDICNKKPFTVSESYDLEDVKTLMLEMQLDCIPVIDALNKVKELLFWNTVLGTDKKKEKKEKITSPIVIMAGGKGTRLAPFTNILPKPLIPIGNKTVLEIIMDKFKEHDVDKFYLTVNYKSRIIKFYLEELMPELKVEFVDEDKPLGTAGSLKLLHGKINECFIVTNCDIIIDADYAELLNYHKSKDNDISMVVSLKHYKIPYGICNIENGDNLVSITEKPEFSYFINTGMYVLKPEVLELIPDNQFYHITDLIEEVKARGGKVGTYPISEKAWVDTGEWEEYKKAIRLFDV
ncbi:nucleotidyltransferase family protein [soil metagenome]